MQQTDLPLWPQAGFAVIQPSKKKGVLQNYRETFKDSVHIMQRKGWSSFFSPPILVNSLEKVQLEALLDFYMTH